MSRHFCIRLIQKLLRIFFFRCFKNRLILILLDSWNLTTYNQSRTIQLEDHISGIAFLAPKRNKSLLLMHKFKTVTKSRPPFLENKLAFFQKKLFLSFTLYDNLIRLQFWYKTVCNFQSMKSSVELKSLFSKIFSYITWFVISPD